MRNILGTTNKEEHFKPGELINMFEEDYIVLKNYGTRGRVRLLNTTLVIDPFYWEFHGTEAKRVVKENYYDNN